jgi:hypothetical protein
VLSNICRRSIPTASASTSRQTIQSRVENISNGSTSVILDSASPSNYFPQTGLPGSLFPLRTRPLPRHEYFSKVLDFNQYPHVENDSYYIENENNGGESLEYDVPSDSSHVSRRSPDLTLPQPFGCGTLDLLQALSVNPTARNAEMFHICKFEIL